MPSRKVEAKLREGGHKVPSVGPEVRNPDCARGDLGVVRVGEGVDGVGVGVVYEDRGGEGYRVGRATNPLRGNPVFLDEAEEQVEGVTRRSSIG